jgi:hypothetical protein
MINGQLPKSQLDIYQPELSSHVMFRLTFWRLTICHRVRVNLINVTIFRSMSADFCFPLPRLLAVPTEAWRGGEICRHLAENGYVNLPETLCHSSNGFVLFFRSIKRQRKKWANVDTLQSAENRRHLDGEDDLQLHPEQLHAAHHHRQGVVAV